MQLPLSPRELHVEPLANLVRCAPQARRAKVVCSRGRDVGQAFDPVQDEFPIAVPSAFLESRPERVLRIVDSTEANQREAEIQIQVADRSRSSGTDPEPAGEGFLRARSRRRSGRCKRGSRAPTPLRPRGRPRGIRSLRSRTSAPTPPGSPSHSAAMARWFRQAATALPSPSFSKIGWAASASRRVSSASPCR